jgi:GNAT superfamily N-acetyltransferase
MNLTRAIPFGHDSTIALKKYIEEPFGPTQLYLDLIAVHPEYQLHGVGTRLVSRGVEIGRKEGVNVTLAALPTSEGFYAHIGFYSDSNFTLKSIDGDKEFRYDVMAYDFDAEE